MECEFMDNIVELILINYEFDNMSQLNMFMNEMKQKLVDCIDPDYSTESSISSEEYNEEEVVQEKNLVLELDDGQVELYVPKKLKKIHNRK